MRNSAPFLLLPLLTVLACAPAAASPAAPMLMMADMPIGAGAVGDDRYAGAAARTVRAIIEYTRWPTRSDPVVICVAGRALYAGQLDAIRLSDGRRTDRRDVAADPGALAGCHVLYLGQLPIARQRQLTAAVRGRQVLTIAEADPTNASEAMIAFTYKPTALSFRLNIDAVSRSGLKVDPRVLRVAQGGQ